MEGAVGPRTTKSSTRRPFRSRAWARIPAGLGRTSCTESPAPAGGVRRRRRDDWRRGGSRADPRPPVAPDQSPGPRPAERGGEVGAAIRLSRYASRAPTISAEGPSRTSPSIVRVRCPPRKEARDRGRDRCCRGRGRAAPAASADTRRGRGRLEALPPWRRSPVGRTRAPAQVIAKLARCGHAFVLDADPTATRLQPGDAAAGGHCAAGVDILCEASATRPKSTTPVSGEWSAATPRPGGSISAI